MYCLIPPSIPYFLYLPHSQSLLPSRELLYTGQYSLRWILKSDQYPYTKHTEWCTSERYTYWHKNKRDALKYFIAYLPRTIFSWRSSWMMFSILETFTLLTRPLIDFFKASQLILWYAKLLQRYHKLLISKFEAVLLCSVI